jgi:phage baseplate assembly protein gpV
LTDDDKTIKATTKITIDAPETKITGNCEIAGELVAKGITYSTHTHGGVDTGSGNTQPPNQG